MNNSVHQNIAWNRAQIFSKHFLSIYLCQTLQGTRNKKNERSQDPAKLSSLVKLRIKQSKNIRIYARHRVTQEDRGVLLKPPGVELLREYAA